MHFRREEQGSEIRGQVAAADESFLLRSGQVFGKLRAGTGAHGARLELVVLYAYKKKENAGLRAYKQGIERELAKKSPCRSS
jgi:hypothetical protein